MTIALITTTKDRPRYLMECAKSVKAQLKQPTEWIIVIDGDDHAYQSVIDFVKKLVPQTVFYHAGDVGRNKALRIAHSLVTSDYVGWLDDDDWLHPYCLSQCDKDKPFIYTDFYCVHTDKPPVVGIRNTKPYTYDALLKDNIVFHYHQYSMDLYHSVGGIDPTFDTTMDYELCLRLLKDVQPHKVDIPLYYYRIHPYSITGRQRDRQITNKQRAIQKHDPIKSSTSK
mgnify:CR=1 FL=1